MADGRPPLRLLPGGLGSGAPAEPPEPRWAVQRSRGRVALWIGGTRVVIGPDNSRELACALLATAARR